MFGAKKKNQMPMPVKMSYESKEVDIPEDYLGSEPPDAKPITFRQIDFESTVLPQYKGAYAVILDHVLSPSECAKLIELAEASVRDEDKTVPGSSWNPALVNAGAGHEVLIPEYRNSDRIIWDNQEIVDRLWARIERVPEIRETLSSFKNGDLLGTRAKEGKDVSWDFHRVNKRMRFLKYGKGQFFRPHCDGAYSEQAEDGSVLRTHFTLHLYLNDSQQEVGKEADLVGGATSFLSGDENRKMDVDPRAGRVLIFQHARLYHSGDDVRQGVKYTVRSDLLYRLRIEEEPSHAGSSGST
ncbi:hypothetical protein DL766_000102 [Monosporascus sp. MC13-8B]|uniref:Prolyl 4-hydroxylase alpha subunit domain-containing protein n=1 Tax=Monosporascus cannonballus TaxID=155416 RepID=A0ABY0H5B9_9PEZI|nr:hypothetical protein DL762_005275 [Monosporascus cannonballus]RYO90424.1 hypothetical protein DL763_005344 [Monosporascus cannonballus]RYP40078.1 hypothetical protein DL766_000102 [Monosporascus sp. MC13-8B]